MSLIRKQIDVLTIGDTAIDAFIRLKDSHVNARVNKDSEELCMSFGDKIPFEYVKVVKAVGNAANAAVSVARLGLRSALVSNLGDDQNGKDCIFELQKNGVNTSLISIHKGRATNYHFVLWYGVDRTILVNHTEFNYSLPSRMQKHMPSGIYSGHGLPPKWIYLSSLASNSFDYHTMIADYLDQNPKVKLAFQPGTFQLKLGVNELKRIYARTDVFIVNLDEALRAIDSAGEKCERSDIKGILKKIHGFGPKIVTVTDNTNGSYMYDGDHFYHAPMYPDPRPAFERTGCGDAWASTFVAAMAMGKTHLEALLEAPINPMSVAQFIGSQEGLLTRDQLEWWLGRAPEGYKIREI